MLMSTSVAVIVVASIASGERPYEPYLLDDVANNTMCPIKAHINDDPNRIPQQIKYLECAEHRNRLCAEKELSVGCCKTAHDGYYTGCVEVYDYVQVQYKDSENHDIISVPVGCSCLISEDLKAIEPS